MAGGSASFGGAGVAPVVSKSVALLPGPSLIAGASAFAACAAGVVRGFASLVLAPTLLALGNPPSVVDALSDSAARLGASSFTADASVFSAGFAAVLGIIEAILSFSTS